MIASTKKEGNAIFAIAAREITKSIKNPTHLGVNILIPVIFIGIMGGSLSQNMAAGLGYNFLQFMMIGMIVNSLFTGLISGMSSLIEERNQNFTQELYVSPISRYSIILGKMIGSSFASLVGLIGILVVALLMQIPLGGMHIVYLFLISPLFCLVGGALGIFFIGFVQDSKTADMGSMMIIMPQMFLSGAMIPIQHSTGILGFLAKLMPMTYCVDLARAVFYAGTPIYDQIVIHHPVTNLLVMTGFFLIFTIVGTLMFTRSERNR
ncbi:ABC transporter permease [Paenibacillus sp. Marseille-Q4541]|uniref:ABC transporter permease n=1 Tax=Paenibacillus sp. Marseille-Q4541 TaxID=2831522 RepID=UPI001BA71BC0|nr:ABC transporter permease [Paenibacillus sp. Marseille-Q4541]